MIDAFFTLASVATVSLECDNAEVPEDVRELEICAVLTEGDLAIDITVDVNTICDQACCEPLLIVCVY